jgi:hypothetical protein
MTMLVEYWRWRYKDPVAGQICRTTARMTADEAAPYPYARRIPGTLAYLDARMVDIGEDDVATARADAVPVAQPQ